MNWTTDPPTQPGWYWVKDLESEVMPWTPAQLVHITKVEDEERLCVTYVGAYYANETDEEVTEDIDDLSGQWAGPLNPPA
jgi:hypothetical protein